MEQVNYEKIITINDESYETISHCISKLIFFIYKENSNPNVEYFRLRLKDSEKSPFSKDLKLEWTCSKQPERSKREDFANNKCKFVHLDHGQNDGCTDPQSTKGICLSKDAVL